LLAPDVLLVKAFNTIGAEHLGDGRFGSDRAFLPIAGDEQGLRVVEPLAEALGFAPVALGGREAFGHLEAHAALWIHLAFNCGWGRDFGFVTRR
jgi:predicted dinucleotide-binding enzyme